MVPWRDLCPVVQPLHKYEEGTEHAATWKCDEGPADDKTGAVKTGLRGWWWDVTLGNELEFLIREG